MEKHYEKATFAAGCFWGVEDMFRKMPGVIEAISGYTGGHKDNPTYEEVCYTDTGHAEAVEVTYDPEKVSYQELLDKFWMMHNPTTRNRQGPDIGTPYRSVIFYHDAEQRQLAETSKQLWDESGKYENPVVTEIVPAQTFWKAEEYHQRWTEKHGGYACHF